jgi:hypothetical protein
VSAVFTVVVIALLLIQELTPGAIAIEPISVPKELAENGYAPEVAARRLRDTVNAFAVEAKASVKGPDTALRGEVPDIVVPTVGISISSIAEAIRGFPHSSLHRRISGEFTIGDRLLWLRLRIDGREFCCRGDPACGRLGQFWSHGVSLPIGAAPSECRLDLIQTKVKMIKNDGGSLCDSPLS